MFRESEPIQISDADRAAIDALMEARFDGDKTPAAMRERCDRILGLLSLLDQLPHERTGDLLPRRTLLAVEAVRRRDQRAETRRAASGLGLGLGLSLGELVAVAAMLLLGISMLWPMLASARGAARQIACQQNLAGAGVGLGAYAAAHQGQMPAMRMRLGDPWWLTGQFDEQGNAQSNSAHLFQLARLGYAPLEKLTCSGNRDALQGLPGSHLSEMFDWPSGQAISFSYQNQYSQDRPRLDRRRPMAVLADKNPFFAPGRYLFPLGLEHRRDAMSENHAARGGQNVLMSDGSVRWLVSPRIGADNIFHVGDEGLDNYTGLEGPRDGDDAFLVY
jgi:hypothetical protein